ncbi:hypothetical protein AVEN_13095-1 [Araneus ventricosus]|uniref:Uncharacterized protein n=1 Tax=Araneus ventricosus TaxID=182803 RepID=A0A4Y2V0H5_ARAVE|nr:hypothetical protein AVEN_13095-1 [Araneus ventricosus]
MQRLVKLLAEVETDEDPDFDNEDPGLDNEDIRPGDDLEEILSDHESFCEFDTESEEDGDSGNEDANNLNFFLQIRPLSGEETNFRQNIRCHNIVSRLPGLK